MFVFGTSKASLSLLDNTRFLDGGGINRLRDGMLADRALISPMLINLIEFDFELGGGLPVSLQIHFCIMAFEQLDPSLLDKARQSCRDVDIKR